MSSHRWNFSYFPLRLITGQEKFLVLFTKVYIRNALVIPVKPFPSVLDMFNECL